MRRPRLHVIGASPAWPNPGEACSCYVVEAGGRRLVLDCGSGAYASLLAHDPLPVDAVFLTHLHHDHVADLVPFGYARNYGRAADWPQPALWVPPGGRERLATLAEAGGARPNHLETAFALSEYDAERTVEVGAARVTFARVEHPGDCFAIRVDADGAAICFSGDTAPTESLPRLARGAGVLLCESAEGGGSSSGVHMGGEDAGAIAAKAGVGRLVLTHVEDFKREDAAAAARRRYDGPVDLAVAGYRADG